MVWGWSSTKKIYIANFHNNFNIRPSMRLNSNTHTRPPIFLPKVAGCVTWTRPCLACSGVSSIYFLNFCLWPWDYSGQHSLSGHIICAAVVQSSTLFPCLYFRPWSMLLSVPKLTIAKFFLLIGLPKSCLAPLQSVLNVTAIWLTAFLVSAISLLFWQKNSIDFLFLHGLSLRFFSSFIKPFWACFLSSLQTV